MTEGGIIIIYYHNPYQYYNVKISLNFVKTMNNGNLSNGRYI